ncbi:diphthamide biosynthesis protein 3 isoform X1 [Natator depressus]|uniref:diphthamide biosynthesis protein 3 isoform X1 n=1 Tax=Natator depressus TaxID=27790 RepID=UPI003EBFCBB7
MRWRSRTSSTMRRPRPTAIRARAGTASSSPGDEDFVDEEDEEEEEVEDSAQQASGESLLPSSQELFITLEPICSQGGLPDHETGEDTSAANVSTLPLSSPSQRLAQIRRQKKRTCDEMFSELMQSSPTERAQQNAWRQTMAETRKVLNECNERREERDERRQEHDERRQDAMLSLMGEQTDTLRRLV